MLSLVGLALLNAGIREFELVTVVPLFVAFTITLGTLQGGVIFNEFDYFSFLQTGLDVLGIFFIIAATIAMVTHEQFYQLHVDQPVDEEMDPLGEQTR